jgi:hypothetical protein
MDRPVIVATGEGVFDLGRVGHDGRAVGGRIGLFLRHHKAAAYRKVAPLGQYLALRIEADKLHAIGVVGQGLAAQEGEVVLLAKGQRVRAGQQDLAHTAHVLEARLNRVGVYGVGHQAFQAQHHRLVGAVAFAGGAQRAVHAHLHAGDCVQQTLVAQPFGKQGGGLHRPHRVGGGWPNANLEQIKNAECHGEALLVAR